MNIAARNMGPYEAASLAYRREIKNRLWNPLIVGKEQPEEKREVRMIEEEQAPPSPLWAMANIDFSAHVDTWRSYHMSPVKSFIKAKCLEKHVKYADLIGPSRKSDIVKARHEIMFEVWQLYSPSYPELARHFGRKDHTTAYSAICKMKRISKGPVWERPCDHAPKIRQMLLAGYNIVQIAEAIGAAKSSVRLYILKNLGHPE